MLLNSLTGLLVVCAVVFGLMAALLSDAQVKRGCFIAFVISLALLGVIVLIAVLNQSGVNLN